MRDDVLALTAMIDAEMSELRRRIERGIVPLLARQELMREGVPKKPAALLGPHPGNESHETTLASAGDGVSAGEAAAGAEVLAMLSQGGMLGVALRRAVAGKGHAAAEVSAAIVSLRKAGAIRQDVVSGAWLSTNAGGGTNGQS